MTACYDHNLCQLKRKYYKLHYSSGQYTAGLAVREIYQLAGPGRRNSVECPQHEGNHHHPQVQYETHFDLVFDVISM